MAGTRTAVLLKEEQTLEQQTARDIAAAGGDVFAMIEKTREAYNVEQMHAQQAVDV